MGPPGEPGSSQGFFLSSEGVFPCHCCPWLAHWGVSVHSYSSLEAFSFLKFCKAAL
ncbi:hypothetical protein SRHO_G00147400 [Serrasalmus rhombeus]